MKEAARRKQEDPKPDLYRKLGDASRERGAQFVKNDKILGRDAALYAWADSPRRLIWIDDKSGETLYGVAWHPVDDRHSGISSVSYNFDYDARSPEESFSLQPPPGYKLVE